VYGVYFDSGEQQYDAGQEGDVAESGHVRAEPRMGMAGRYGSDFRYVGREVFEGEGIAADNPYQRHDDDDDARQHGSDEEAAAGDFRYDGASLEGEQRGQPVDHNREYPDELAVVGEFRFSDGVGDGCRREAEDN